MEPCGSSISDIQGHGHAAHSPSATQTRGLKHESNGSLRLRSEWGALQDYREIKICPRASDLICCIARTDPGRVTLAAGALSFAWRAKLSRNPSASHINPISELKRSRTRARARCVKRINFVVMAFSGPASGPCLLYPLPPTGAPLLHPHYQASLLLWAPPTSAALRSLPRFLHLSESASGRRRTTDLLGYRVISM
jgi:hypothetical protein